MRQDAGKDPARPLIGQGLVLGTIDAGALKLCRIVVGDIVIEALATVTVGTTGDIDASRRPQEAWPRQRTCPSRPDRCSGSSG